MMMFYRCRASPKLRDDMTEVEYGGGGHRIRLRNDPEINLCVLGCPLPPYIKEPRGRGRPTKEGAPRGGPTPTGSRTPFFPSWSRRRGKEEEEGKERGASPPSPCPIRTREGRGRSPPLASSPLLP